MSPSRETRAPALDQAAHRGDDEMVPILVVDDQTSNLEALDAMLAQSGCHLVRAHSADEALLALLDGDFAAIVLDIKMPGMSGLELAQLIKQRRRTKHVPILFLTAHLLEERDVLRGYRTGAVDYLTKPVHSEILRQKIEVFVELFRKTRALAHLNDSLQREIAERERAQQELREMNQDLERRVQERTEALQQADRRKDEFLASLAHELRNPLAPVRSAVEVLRLKAASDPDLAAASAILVRQVDHMTRLIDDLLDVSRITVDKLVLQKERVSLNQAISAAIETSRPLILERRHQLTVVLPDEPVELDADPARLAQMLSNLLTNAAKYTAPGGEVRIDAETAGGWVTIRVSDSGIGISREMLSRIFDLFTQGDHGGARSSGGLGIGLALARRLAEMHGGTLDVRSDGPGTGSEFSVRLPVLADSSARTIDNRAHELADEVIASRRVLVVDDNQDAAQMLAMMLATWGQEACIAYDGVSALRLGGEFRPDLVLLDIGLPDLDGYETARRMREQAWGKSAVLVAVTGWGQETDRQRSRDAGFNHHLVKPVAPQMLRALVKADA